jgi:hypothetical protein
MNFFKHILLFLLYKIKLTLKFLREKIIPENESLRPLYFSSFKLYEKEELEKCYNHFKKYFKHAMFLETNKLRKYAIVRATENNVGKDQFYIEFGVWKGQTINYLSNFVETIYGFDSFEGLKEDWVGVHNKPKGTFNLNKKIPKLNKNIIPVVGQIQDTLEPFLKKNQPRINFIHIDVDTYESTKYILNALKPFILNKAIILFDEIYNSPGWDVGEYKALTEIFKENEYKFIAFSIHGGQAAVEIVK